MWFGAAVLSAAEKPQPRFRVATDAVEAPWADASNKERRRPAVLVREVMTRKVITVDEDAPLKDVAGLMLHHRISGLPVVDGDRVLGVVSETDVLFKERGTESPRPGFLGRRARSSSPSIRRKCAARTAGEAMTAPAITIAGRAAVGDAAALMLEHRVNRLPVVDKGRLVGIVTRADLVRTFTRSDDDIEHELRDDVLLRTLWMSPDRVGIDVSGGEVQLRGAVENDSAASALIAFAKRVPGVVAVESHLSWPQNGHAREEER
jgi:CBS domain-containing protein